jgi:caffeoyl-CoA O-methyltransferase
MEKAAGIDPAVSAYLARHRSPDDPLLRELREETLALGKISGMQVAAGQGQFLATLIASTGASRVLEVGTFTGYSSICMAKELPEDGKLICFDVSEEYTAVARRYWEKAGLADRIELRLGPALETLAALPEGEWVDFAFVDADKVNYWNYVQEIIPRMRRNGLIVVDNVLWAGAVVKPDDQRETTVSIRQFNERIVADARVDNLIVAIGDGLNILRKL